MCMCAASLLKYRELLTMTSTVVAVFLARLLVSFGFIDIFLRCQMKHEKFMIENCATCGTLVAENCVLHLFTLFNAVLNEWKVSLFTCAFSNNFRYLQQLFSHETFFVPPKVITLRVRIFAAIKFNVTCMKTIDFNEFFA